MSRALPAALLITALVLAGCSAPMSSDPTYGVPDSAFPPGVDRRGIENSSVLFDAHFAALNETGYRDRSVHRHVGPNAENERVEANETVLLTASPEMETVRFTVTKRHAYPSTPAVDRWTTWSNRSVAVTHTRCPGNGTALSHDDASRRIFLTYLRTPVHGYLNADGYEFTDVNRSANRTLFTLRASGANALDWSNVTVTSFEATLVVDSTGRIHRFRSRATTRDDDGRKSIRVLRYDLLDVGVPDVPRPAWTDRALRSGTDGGCPVPGRT